MNEWERFYAKYTWSRITTLAIGIAGENAGLTFNQVEAFLDACVKAGISGDDAKQIMFEMERIRVEE